MSQNTYWVRAVPQKLCESLPPIKAPIPPSHLHITRVLANKRPSSRRGGPFCMFACRSSAGVPPLPNPSPPPLRLVIRITAPIANEPPQLLPGSSEGRARAPRRAGAIDRRGGDSGSGESSFHLPLRPKPASLRDGWACLGPPVAASLSSSSLTTRVRLMLQAGGAAAHEL